MSGHVVGVNSAIATLDQGQGSPDEQSGSIGVGFSIPIDEAQRVVGELEKTGHATHAVLGIGLQDSEDANLHTPNGAKVVSVTAGGRHRRLVSRSTTSSRSSATGPSSMLTP